MLINTQRIYVRRLFFSFSIAKNHYQILEIPQEASFKQVREHYITKSKQLHPDISPSSHEQYQQVQQAYKTLISPQHRKKYDLTIGIRQSLWQRQLDMSAFSQTFQSKMYDEILNKDNIKVTVNHSSVEEQLQEKFKEEISHFKVSQIFKSASFYGCVIGLGIFWAIWNFLELFVMNYKGSNKHKIQFGKTDKTLKAIPVFTR